MIGERSKFIEKSIIKHGDKFDYSYKYDTIDKILEEQL